MASVGKYDKDKIREEAERQKKEAEERANRTDIVWHKWAEGDNKIRILPPPADSDVLFVKTATHWGVGPNKVNLNAPVDDKGRITGWLQEKAAELADSDDDADKAVAASLWPRKAWLYNIYDPNNLEKGIQVMSVGVTVHAQICAYLADTDNEYGDITDLDEGFNLTVTVTNAGTKEAKYTNVRAARNPSPVPDEILEQLEEEGLPDLTKVRPVASDEEMEKTFLGLEDEDTEKEELDEEAPAPTVVRKRAAKTVVEEEEPEDEAPAPTRRSFGSRLRTAKTD